MKYPGRHLLQWVTVCYLYLSVRTYPFSLDLLKSFLSVPLSFKPFVGQLCVLSHLYLQSS